MRFSIDVADEARDAAVPLLILQPLAENAVRHGIARTAAAGAIDVQAQRRGDRILIHMLNSGTLDSARSDGIGLKNTRQRLASLYGDDARFSLEALDGGVLAMLDLPWSTLR